jgi:hypothetical protein
LPAFLRSGEFSGNAWSKGHLAGFELNGEARQIMVLSRAFCLPKLTGPAAVMIQQMQESRKNTPLHLCHFRN